MKIINPVAITDTRLTTSNVAETSPAANEWSSATAYVVNDQVTVTYTGAGASVATHLIYTCQANHTNQDPTIAANIPTYWLATDATNRFRMFNGVLQQATTNANTIAVEILPGQIVNSLALFGVDAVSVNVTMNDPTDGDVFDQDYSMVSPSGITDWYLYFTEPVVRLERLFVEGMPIYPNASLLVTIDDTGATAQCGEMVIGRTFVLGDSQYGASFGIIDYSVKSTTAAGVVTVTAGAYADTADVNVVIDTNRFDVINSTLKSYRSTPLVWIAEGTYTESIVYGYFRNFRNIISGPVVSTTLLQLEGLT